MTCIIGLVSDGKVYMGGDSAGARGWTVRPMQNPKVFEVGPFIIGGEGSNRMYDVLQYHLKVQPQDGESDHEYMICQFAEAVRATLKEHGVAKIENNVEKGGIFLVGYRGHLYWADSDFQISEDIDGYDACGCGQEFALGAMMALEELPPKKRIRRALEIAAHFSGGVMEPFTVIKQGAGPSEVKGK